MLPLTGSHVSGLAGGVVSAPIEALLAATIATDSTALGVEPGAQRSQTTLDGALWCLGCSLSANPNIRGLLQGEPEHPDILAQSDQPTVDLRVTVNSTTAMVCNVMTVGSHYP